MFELHNPFDYTVTVEALLINEESFHLTEDRCTGATLPGSDVCTFAVVFSPRNEGETQALITVKMTHTCTSNTYWPCSWVPPPPGIGVTKNFTRDELPTGQVVFHWETLLAMLIGQGTAAGPPTS